jgi:hypothetical protein
MFFDRPTIETARGTGFGNILADADLQLLVREGDLAKAKREPVVLFF